MAVDGYLPSPERRPAPLPGATYRWDGELVYLDETTGTLTVKSRVASPKGLAAVADAQAGAPIVITWSGYDSQANGILSAMPDDGATASCCGRSVGQQPLSAASGVRGDRRHRTLPDLQGQGARGTFVEADDTGRYLTFETAVPAQSLATVRSLTRGSWASVTSPHHPSDGSPAVLSVDAYVPLRERRPAPLPGASYRWDGQLLALDESTGTVTVKSRAASPAGLAAVAGAKSGAPIVITWSGYGNRASGIRAAMPDDDSGLWGSNRFLLRAAFVETDDTGRYLTFKVAGDSRGSRRRRALPDLQDQGARGEPGDGAVADARLLGEGDVAASSGGRGPIGDGRQRVRAVAGAPAGALPGRDLSLGRGAGFARRIDRHADGEVARGLAGGSGVGGRCEVGGADRHHLVRLPEPGERDPDRDAG
jgi:hypothetical protein